MDLPPIEMPAIDREHDVRNFTFNEFSTSKLLDHASQQARQRNYQDFLIVDVDSHHYESESY